jgi:osmoprotectant transport system ATP-binding protein
VARALAADPPVLLMDEPFGAVDPIVRKRLQGEFHDLQQRLGKTVVFVTHDVDEAIFLGNRMAILNIGGILEQYDTPEAILADPANQFVADFLGGERGLKRLALRPVSKVDIIRGPVVDVSSDAEEALRAMSTHGVDWVGLLDGSRLLGWVYQSELSSGPLRQLEPKPFAASLTPRSSLRQAIDAVVTGRTRVAVVVDNGEYVGMVDLESIAEEITE